MHLFNRIVDLWLTQIRHAEDTKEKQFGKTARRCWDFLGKSYDKLYATGGEEDFPHSTHKIRRNLTAEYRALMLPYVHHKVPHRLVTPSRSQPPPELLGMPPGMPMPQNPLEVQDKARAWLIQWALNYWPTQYDLRGECRKSITEALIKGRGIVWHEFFPSASGMIPGSFYDSVDNLLIDPDVEHQLRDAGYIVRKRLLSIWRVAEEWGIPASEIQGKYQSHLDRSGQEANRARMRNKETGAVDTGSNDIVEVYYVYSRMGLGQKFTSVASEIKDSVEALNSVGDNVFLAICPGLDYPLNLPPHISELPNAQEEIHARLQWPVPFHAIFNNPWPFTPLDFYSNLDNPWAQSPLEASLPLQVFLDRAYGFLMSRVRSQSRDIILTSKSMEKELRAAITSGDDQTVVPFDGVAEDIRKMLDVIQFPELSGDLWKVISMVENALERAIGISALMYGMSGGTQMRSSAEAQIRQDNMTNRPEDMAECAERWNADIASSEAFMGRVGVAPATMAPLFGEQAPQESAAIGQVMGPWTQAWAMLVNTEDPQQAAAELAYTIEAGSGRKKNKQKQQADAEMLVQTMFGPLLGFAQSPTGSSGPFNALVRFIGDTYDIRLDDMMLPPMPPQPPPGAGGPSTPQPQGAPT